SAARKASSSALRFITGSAPGYPRQTGQTLVFGAAPKAVGQAQKIFVAVSSRAWTSRPMTASHDTAGGYNSSSAHVALDVVSRLRFGGNRRCCSCERLVGGRKDVAAVRGALVLRAAHCRRLLPAHRRGGVDRRLRSGGGLRRASAAARSRRGHV